MNTNANTIGMQAISNINKTNQSYIADLKETSIDKTS